MRLNKFLFEFDPNWKKYSEPRSKTIDLEEAVDFVHKNCMDALDGTLIKRQLYDNWQDHYRFTNPKAGKPRVSRNTQNYYTLIIDNSPNWRNFPKRSKSLICGIGRRTGGFHVFPENGSKIGVCPSYDFWACFNKQGIYSLDTLNNIIEELARTVTRKTDSFDDKLSSIKFEFRIIDKFKESAPERIKVLTDKIWKSDDGKWLRPYIETPGLKLYDFIENILNPKRNRFKIAKVGDKITGDLEVWTDGRAVLVNHLLMETFLNELERRKSKIA